MAKEKKLSLLLGVTLITQATTSIVGGLIGFGPFTDTEDISATMNSIADNIGRFYASIFIQFVTAIVIVVLAVALYQAGKKISKTAAIVAMGFYCLEVVILIFDQMLTFGVTEISQQFASNGDIGLLYTAELLLSIKDFGGAISMLPFGLGAILFYFLIMKATVIPKWLGLWGMISVTFIFVGWTLQAFGVSIPFVLYIPYVPWEWVAGIYILARGLKESHIPVSDL